MDSSTGTLTLAVPVFNEVGSLERLYEALTEVIGALACPCEIIFVDDGSRDGSSEMLDKLEAGDERVRVLHFRRNYGKSAALDAAFRHAEGDIVITLDADMQDDPTEIPRFIEKINEGYDMVSGWKRLRHDPIDKTLPSRIFNAVVRRSSGLSIHDFNCGFKAYRAECLTDLRLYGELHRFIPALLHWSGFTVAEIEVTHHERRSGQSKYGMKRIVTGAFDLLTVLYIARFRSRPMHFFGYIALVIGMIGATALAYLFVISMLGIEALHPRPMLYASQLLILTSVLLISTGLLGELIKSLSRSAPPDYLIKARKTKIEIEKPVPKSGVVRSAQ